MRGLLGLTTVQVGLEWTDFPNMTPQEKNGLYYDTATLGILYGFSRLGGVWGGGAVDDAAAQTFKGSTQPSSFAAAYEAQARGEPAPFNADAWRQKPFTDINPDTGLPVDQTSVASRVPAKIEGGVPALNEQFPANLGGGSPYLGIAGIPGVSISTGGVPAVAANGDQPTISIIGVRGGGSSYDAEGIQHPYQYTGHVGYSFDSGKEIWGFGPATGDASMADVFATLKPKGGEPGGSYPGIITADQDAFALIASNPVIARGGGGVPQTVYELKIPVTQEQFDAIQAAHDLLVARGAMDDIRYQFPPKSGDWAPNMYNCATFPSCLGIPIPETTGQLSRYMPELERLGTPWTPPAQPKQ